ncbi:hypothetical protein [Pelagibius sp.]|uniref:hypothetical protein n=1 Tax=Pelagibius sp. TaxID=1931238 RepID=UPI00262E101E|nr:hypothetical protein [Pelagibius sp.]
MDSGDLRSVLQNEVDQQVSPPVAAIVAAARQRHGETVAAVLFYGSCLQQDSVEGKIVDLYLLVDDYRSAHHGRLSALLNWALPPNVYYLETPFEGTVVRAKYAVISLADFARGAGGGWFHPYLWARFAQPCRLAHCRDEAVRTVVIAALEGAVRKTMAEGLALRPGATVHDVWTAVFRQSYSAELRAEPPERIARLLAANEDYFARAGTAALIALQASGTDTVTKRSQSVGARWLLRRLQGKLLSALRLIKAAFTFQNGAQYLQWKIERHSGVAVTLTPWQRRHPVLASTVLFWQLYRRGAFK